MKEDIEDITMEEIAAELTEKELRELAEHLSDAYSELTQRGLDVGRDLVKLARKSLLQDARIPYSRTVMNGDLSPIVKRLREETDMLPEALDALKQAVGFNNVTREPENELTFHGLE